MKNKIVQFPGKKVQNPAMQQITIEEMKKRLNDTFEMFLKVNGAMQTKVKSLEAALKDAFVRAEALVDAVATKGLITAEELAASNEKIKKGMEMAEEIVYNTINKLEIVDRPAVDGDIAVVLFNATDITDGGSTKIEENQKVELELLESKYNHTQMKEVVKDLIGKKAGDKNVVTFTVPKDEANNPFAGKTTVFDYEVIKIKAKINEQQPGATIQ